MNYSARFISVLFAVATFAGFLGALLGVGGGVFIVPALVLGFGLPVKIAVAASLVSVIATSNAGGSSYVEQHIANLRLAMFLEVATTSGALLGSALALILKEWLMLLIFAALLFYLAGVAWRSRNSDQARILSGAYERVEPDRFARACRLSGSYHDQHLNREVAYRVTGAAPGLFLSALAGVASGLLGIGGGVIKVSAMNKYMNVPMKAAVGTSKLMIGVTAAVGSLLFLMAGLIQFYVVAPVALGTTLGATVGTHVMNRLPSAALKWVFAGLMIYLGYTLAAKGLGEGFAWRLPVLS